MDIQRGSFILRVFELRRADAILLGAVVWFVIHIDLALDITAERLLQPELKR